mmetsp:Transcript_66722/g.211205  ORF Transcript_66722/g.211205 Transcript_66722/m.211205 type:complete len:281 (+) Transcript_66722:78-920(+)
MARFEPGVAGCNRPEGVDRALVLRVLLPPQHGEARALADLALVDHAAGDLAARPPEDGLDSGRADDVLLDHGQELTLHVRLDLIQERVDHVVRANLHPERLGRGAHRLRGLDTEPDDDTLRGAGEVHVALGDLPRCGEEEAQRHAVLRQHGQRGLDRLHCARRVGLEDHVHALDLLLVVQLEAVQGHHAAAARLLRDALQAREVRLGGGHLPRQLLRLHHLELRARDGHAIEAEHLHRHGRAAALVADGLAQVVHERAHLAVEGAARDAVPFLQRARLDQ